MIQLGLFDDVRTPAASRRGRSGAAAAEVGEAAAASPPAKKPKRKRRPKPTVATDAPISYVARNGAWTLVYPAPAKLMSVNTGKHWRQTGPVKKAWREASFLHATAAKLPKGLARVRIDIELRFPTAGRDRDESNYHHYAAKPTVDGLGPARVYQIQKGAKAGQWVTEVGYGLIADDNPRKFLHCQDCPHIRIAQEPVRDKAMPFGQVAVTITDLSGVAS